jgi:hypothetical protein
MVWNRTNWLVLAEDRLQIISSCAYGVKGESSRNGATFANASEHADSNPIT